MVKQKITCMEEQRSGQSQGMMINWINEFNTKHPNANFLELRFDHGVVYITYTEEDYSIKAD